MKVIEALSEIPKKYLFHAIICHLLNREQGLFKPKYKISDIVDALGESHWTLRKGLNKDDVIKVAKLVCMGAEAACPIIKDM